MRRFACFKIYIAVILVVGTFVLPDGEAAASGKKEKKSVKWKKSPTGINSLMTLSRDRGAMIKQFKTETENYKKVRSSFDSDMFHKGQRMEDIRRKYGEAVVENISLDGTTTQWVYKPSEATFFAGPKITLSFDSRGDLESWEIYEKSPEPAR